MSIDSETLYLTLVQGNKPPQEFSFTSETVTIGRATTCAIPLTDAYLSRHHAEIVPKDGAWILFDCDSANGTYLNGALVEEPTKLGAGDRITLGNTTIIIEDDEPVSSDTITMKIEDSQTPDNWEISVMDLETAANDVDQSANRLNILNQLTMELIDDRPMEELFGFIVDRVMHLLSPSRVALGILVADKKSFSDVTLRTANMNDSHELAISQTLLNDVVEKRQVVAYTDIAESTDLREAKSIMDQGIRSALCAPIVVQDDTMGVLYMDYTVQTRSITDDDTKLLAKIARIAARKLETTILREESQAKQKMDQEMQTAALIQKRLLPQESPAIEGYLFDGRNRPCHTVGGDYYDFVVRPDGRIYFMIADVSGKGMTAALVMAVVAAAFNTLTNHDPTPSQILSDLNQTLARKTATSMFVTAFCGVLDPKKAEVVYSCAGHTPPLIVRENGEVKRLEVRPGLVLGFLPDFPYVEETMILEAGSTLYLYTDGITEAMNSSGEIFTMERLTETLGAHSRRHAGEIAVASIDAVDRFAGGAGQADDMTLLCVQRLSETIVGGETLPF